mgnify:CR=1 FL=1
MAYESSSGEVPAEAVEYISVSWWIVGKSKDLYKPGTKVTYNKKEIVRLVSLC